MQDIDQNIIQQAAHGDEQAFEIIYRAYFRFVANVAHRIVRETEEAEEICQEVFLTIYRKLDTFRRESSLKTWIYRITINCALKYAKKMNKHSKQTVEYDETMPVASPGRDVRETMDQTANERMIQQLLDDIHRFIGIEINVC
jgi:RNA polymerase sigma-70 factor (ECF subfamily)